MHFLCISLNSFCFCLIHSLSHSVNVPFLTIMCVHLTVCLFLFLFVHVCRHMIVLYPVNELLHVYISLHSLKFRNLYNTGYSETVMLHTHRILILLSLVLSMSFSFSGSVSFSPNLCVPIYICFPVYIKCFCFACLYLSPHFRTLWSLFWTEDLYEVSR